MIDEKKLIEEVEDMMCPFQFADETREWALKDVIEVIEEQTKVNEWIPCNERLPEEKKFYEENMRSLSCLVIVLSDDELMVGIDRTVNGVWTLEETFDKPEVIAWMPLPEPYECHSKKLKRNSKGETE